MVQLKRKVTLKEKHEVADPEKRLSDTKVPKQPSSVSETKSKSWIPFLLCGLLIVGVSIYFLAQNTTEPEKTCASNEAKQETASNQNKTAVISVSDDQHGSDSFSVLVIENKEVNPNEEATVVENKNESRNQDSYIVENEESPNSSIETKKTESVVKIESISASEIERTAKDVIRGKYGNGRIRKDKLGNRYFEIQSKVNEMYRKGF